MISLRDGKFSLKVIIFQNTQIVILIWQFLTLYILHDCKILVKLIQSPEYNIPIISWNISILPNISLWSQNYLSDIRYQFATKYMPNIAFVILHRCIIKLLKRITYRCIVLKRSTILSSNRKNGRYDNRFIAKASYPIYYYTSVTFKYLPKQCNT